MNVCEKFSITLYAQKEKIKVLVRREISGKLVTHLWTEISSAPLYFSVCFPATSLPLDNNIIVSSAQNLCGQCSSTQWITFKWGEDSEVPRTESSGGCLIMEIEQNMAVPARHKSCLTSTYQCQDRGRGRKRRKTFPPPKGLHKKTKKWKERGYTTCSRKPQLILSCKS